MGFKLYKTGVPGSAHLRCFSRENLLLKAKSKYSTLQSTILVFLVYLGLFGFCSALTH